jgi:polyisoprenoid-binding protein YceI
MRKHLWILLILAFGTDLIAQKAHTPAMVDLGKSVIEWTGKKLTGEHYGEIKLSDGQLNFQADRLIGGSFEIDMASIVCTDITDAKSNKRLVDHLKSDEFFSVNRFPKARLDLSKVTYRTDTQYDVTGKVTIKGKSDIVSFPVQFKTLNGTRWVEAAFVIDRSKFDVRFGSQSFFENLGDTMVYDDIDIKVRLMLNEN